MEKTETEPTVTQRLRAVRAQLHTLVLDRQTHTALYQRLVAELRTLVEALKADD